MPAVIHQLVEYQVIAGRFHSATVCGFAPSGNPHLIVATNGTTWPDIGDGNGTDPAGRCYKLYEDVVERDCPTAGTLLGHLDEIRPGSTVVATEGVADTITAALAWTDGVILGAHGACNLPAVARAAAVRAASVRARLVLAPHDDATGRSAAIEAAHAAIDAGLSLRDGSLIVIKHGEKDLNDAWRNGWRPA